MKKLRLPQRPFYRQQEKGERERGGEDVGRGTDEQEHVGFPHWIT